MHKKLVILFTAILATLVTFAAAKCTKCGSIAPDGWKLCPKCKAKADKLKKEADKKKKAEAERIRKEEEKQEEARRHEEEKRLWNEREAARKAQEEKEKADALKARRNEINALPPAKWTITKDVDKITDELAYFISVKGTPITINSLLSYSPELVLKVKPLKMTSEGMAYKSEWMVIIETEGLRRDGCEMTTRWDKEAATKSTWATSTDRRAAFAPRPSAFFDDVTMHANLTIRFETTLGDIRTAQFYLPGLGAKMNEVKSMYKAATGQ